MRSQIVLAAFVLATLMAGCGLAPSQPDGVNPPPDGGPWPELGKRDLPWWPPDLPRVPDKFRPPDWYRPPDFHKWDKWPWPVDYGPYTVKEQVTCQFLNSSGPQTCWSSKGPSCTGVGSCTVTVSGIYGEQIYWKSSCPTGSAPTTFLDGKDELAQFKCSPSTVSETVTCQFSGTTSASCWSTLGSCSGVGSCKVYVNGPAGQVVSWGSSCGAAAKNTTLDGVNETITFNCGTTISETVTCLFPGSKLTQSCDSIKGSCQGVTSCSVIVSGTVGEKVDWKSTCGGYFTTIIDGKSETLTFPCLPMTVTETVTCWFKGSTTFQQCYASSGESCQGLLGCTVTVTGQMNSTVSWKSSCGGYATTITDGKDEPANFYCPAALDGGPPPPPPPPILDGGMWP